jgi:hypothetical protein
MTGNGGKPGVMFTMRQPGNCPSPTSSEPTARCGPNPAVRQVRRTIRNQVLAGPLLPLLRYVLAVRPETPAAEGTDRAPAWYGSGRHVVLAGQQRPKPSRATCAGSSFWSCTAWCPASRPGRRTLVSAWGRHERGHGYAGARRSCRRDRGGEEHPAGSSATMPVSSSLADARPR